MAPSKYPLDCNASSAANAIATPRTSGLRPRRAAAVAAADTVVATARNVTALDDLVAAHPGQVEDVPLDVTDTASIPGNGSCP